MIVNVFFKKFAGYNTGEGQRLSTCSRVFAGIVCSRCGAEGRRLVRGGACCAGALTITSVFVHVTFLAAAVVLGERWVPALILCAALSPIQILSIQTASTAERDFGESRLHYTYQLDFQHNPTSLHYFTRVYWPQFTSLDRFLPSFLRLSSFIAFQFLFITSRSTATTHILTTIQTSVNPLNSVYPKVSCRYLQLPLL